MKGIAKIKVHKPGVIIYCKIANCIQAPQNKFSVTVSGAYSGGPGPPGKILGLRVQV